MMKNSKPTLKTIGKRHILKMYGKIATKILHQTSGTPANSALRSEDRVVRDGERDAANYRINERSGEAVSGGAEQLHGGEQQNEGGEDVLQQAQPLGPAF